MSELLAITLVHCECGGWVHERDDLEAKLHKTTGNVSVKHRNDLQHFRLERTFNYDPK